MATESSTPAVLALVADLLFASRIQGTARALGVRAVTVRAAHELRQQAALLQPYTIFVELDARTSEAALAAITELKADPGSAHIPIIAFVAHVQESLIAAAREAGADRVLARSAFARDLPRLLQP